MKEKKDAEKKNSDREVDLEMWEYAVLLGGVCGFPFGCGVLLNWACTIQRKVIALGNN